MNCKSVQNRLSAYLDRELGGDELLQMRAHLSMCLECRSEAEGLRSLRALLGGMPVPEPPTDFAAKLTANVLRQKTEEPKRAFRASALMFAGVTACSMIVTLAVYGMVSHGSPTTSPSGTQESGMLTIDNSFGNTAPVISAANFGPR
jgi:anti-sigma factor RsiW